MVFAYVMLPTACARAPLALLVGRSDVDVNLDPAALKSVLADADQRASPPKE